MLETKNPKNIELPLENCKICGTPTNPCDMFFVPPRSKICGRCYATFYKATFYKGKKQMNRYNAQILNDKGEYHLQFETDSRENFDAMERMAQRFMDKKPQTNFDKITESAEALAEFIKNNTSNCYHCFLGIDGKCKSALKYLGDEICKIEIMEWLNKECEE